MTESFQSKIAKLEHQTELLSKILSQMDCPSHVCAACRSVAFYWDHYDDDKTRCKICNRNVCLKCIGNHCNFCDNFYNIVCKDCVELKIGEDSSWCESCQILSCDKCRTTLYCDTCEEVYDLGMCPYCYVKEPDSDVRLCKCGQILCKVCQCIQCISLSEGRVAGEVARGVFIIEKNRED